MKYVVQHPVHILFFMKNFDPLSGIDLKYIYYIYIGVLNKIIIIH